MKMPANLPAPPDKEYLPYQVDGIRFCASRKASLLADEMGLGKTIQAIGAINLLGAKKVLVVCPAGLKLNWARELKSWLTVKRNVQILMTSGETISPAADIVIVNYDLLTYGMKYDKDGRILGGGIYDQLVSRDWAIGIFDEAHYMKNREAARTCAVLQKGRIASRCIYKIFMTGTPVLNRPVELYPILRAAARDVIEPYSDFRQYAIRYCDGYLEKDTQIFRCEGATHTDELNERLHKNFMLRRLKADVLKDLPEKRYQIVPLSLTDATRKLVESEFQWDAAKFKRIAVGGDLGEMTTHRREIALAKLNQCCEFICSVFESVEKLVVFAYHRDVIKGLAENLSHFNPVVVMGGISAKDKQNAVDQFQTDEKTRLFIGQIEAAGTGITLTAASHIVFVESSWVPGIVHQAIDRCHRIGQKNSVLAQFLVVEKSIEETIMRTIVDKMKVIKSIVEKAEKQEDNAEGPEWLFS